MAKRIIEIDGGSILADTGSSIRNALEQTGRESVPTVVSGGEIITASDFNRPAPPHGMLTNLTPIEKGATLRERLLDQELDLIATSFLREFPAMRRSVELDDNMLLIRAFPLPDDYTPDHVDLLIVTRGYPDVPPAGVHIPSKSPNIKQIANHLGGHVMDKILSRFRERIEEVVDSEWSWVCYHYNDWSWRLNPNDLLAGDCLYKYIENLFAALSGGHRD